MNFQNAISSLRFKKENQFVLAGNEPYLKEFFININDEYSYCSFNYGKE